MNEKRTLEIARRLDIPVEACGGNISKKQILAFAATLEKEWFGEPVQNVSRPAPVEWEGTLKFDHETRVVKGTFDTTPATTHLPANNQPLTLAEWSRQVRIIIRGIDGQAERLVGPPPLSNWKAEEIIVGYKLNTGLWHQLLGLLACCPEPEGN